MNRTPLEWSLLFEAWSRLIREPATSRGPKRKREKMFSLL